MNIGLRLAATVALASIGLAAPRTVWAQAEPDSRSANPPPAIQPLARPARPTSRDLRRIFVFEAERKSVWGALALEVLPGVGSIYAEDTTGALTTLGFIAGGAALMVLGVSMVGGGEGADYRAGSPAAMPLALGGLGLCAFGRGYGFVNAARAAARYNTELLARVGLPPEPSSPSWGR